MARWQPDLIGFMEALYRVDQSRDQWLESVLDAACGGLGRSMGVGALLYDMSDASGGRVEGMRARNVSPGWLEAGQNQHRDPTLTPVQREAYRSMLCGTATELAARGTDDAQRRITGDMARHGIQEMVMVNGANPESLGCALFIFSHDEFRLQPGLRHDLTRLAIHIASAYRLHRRLAQSSTHAAPVDAVLRTDGKLEHAERFVSSEQDRAELSQAARNRAWALSRGGREQPQKSIALWRGLVSGRWSLVDSFESDGKRYVLARQNAPAAAGPATLSDRERQVAMLARLGRSNKVIAYELGIAHATVRVLLARASAKLGVRSRDALIAALNQEAEVRGS